MNSDLEVHDQAAKVVGKEIIQLLWEKGFVVVEKDRVVKLSGSKAFSAEHAHNTMLTSEGERAIKQSLMARAAEEVEFDYDLDTTTGQLRIVGSFRFVKLGKSLFDVN